MRPISVQRRGPARGGGRGGTTGRRLARLGAAIEGQPQVAASRMGVGPLQSIDEVAEGDEVMEKRGRQEGITTEQAKGRTQRWQPLLPNLRLDRLTADGGEGQAVRRTRPLDQHPAGLQGGLEPL